MSVRAWQGVVTAGLLAPDGRSRTEVVVDATTGAELRRYPAAVFGGAVAASRATTVVVGPAAVTSYDNATGRVRWQHKTAGGQSWQVDGQTLYVAESAGGYLSSSPVTALKVIDLATGTERVLSSPLGRPFSGTLAIAADGAVLFASPAGVTAYSGSTGGTLWAMPRRGARGDRPGRRAGLPHVGQRRADRRRPADRHGASRGARARGHRRGGHVRGPRRGRARPQQRRERRGLGVRHGQGPGRVDLAATCRGRTSSPTCRGLAAAPRPPATWWSSPRARTWPRPLEAAPTRSSWRSACETRVVGSGELAPGGPGSHDDI